MTISQFFLVVPLLLFSLIARADNSSTTEQVLDSLLTTYKSACSEGGLWYEQLKTPDSIAIGARQMICECTPSRAAKLKSSLSPSELESQMSGGLYQRFVTEVIDPCAAPLARAMYGPSCADRIGKYKTNGSNYCSCMSSYLASISDREATQIGLDAAQHLPAMQQAKKQGLPLPEPPPVYRRFSSAEAACSKD